VGKLLPIIGKFLDLQDDIVIEHTYWCLFYISSWENEAIQNILDLGITPRLLMRLNHENKTIRNLALRTVANMMTGYDDQILVRYTFVIRTVSYFFLLL
jgi:hypothetical protein